MPREEIRPAANRLTMDQSKLAARECLLFCARSRVDGSGSLESILRQDIDWQELADLGRRHGLLPLAYNRIRHLHGDPIPRKIMARLQDSYYGHLARNLRLQATLAEAVAALQQDGIEPVVLKGGALAGTVYGDPGLRPMTDLDLLVPPEAMERAGAVLASIGYHLSGRLNAQLVIFQARFGGRLEWLREQHGQLTYLDVQSDLVGVDLWRHAFAIEPDTLWAAARTLPLDRGQALQLSPEDTLIHVCLHRAMNHAYASPLIGVVDVDRLVAAEASDDFWERLVERAEQFKVGTIVHRGLCTARDLLGTPVPAGTLAALAPGALRRHLLGRLAPVHGEHAWKGEDSRPSGVRELLLYAALIEHPWDALRVLRAILFPDREWLAARYGLEGKWRARLYGLVHPFRVARALLRGLRRPLIQSGLE